MEVILDSAKRYIDQCLKLAKALPDYFSKNGLIQIETDLQKHEVFVLTEGNLIEGFLTIDRKHPQLAEISWMATKRDVQRQGYGTFLLNGVVKILKESGVKAIEVKTLAATSDYPPYKKTRAFYAKNGFISLDVIDPYPAWDEGNPCQIYIKIL